MTSSKFGGRLPPFKVPAICAKATPSGGELVECNENPDPIIAHAYEVDVTWFIYHWAFNGTLLLTLDYEWKWSWPKSMPADGEYGEMIWTPGNNRFASHIRNYQAGMITVAFTTNFADVPPNPCFDTELFVYPSPIWVGTKNGRHYNP